VEPSPYLKRAATLLLLFIAGFPVVLLAHTVIEPLGLKHDVISLMAKWGGGFLLIAGTVSLFAAVIAGPRSSGE
jgi:hypothetical protein